MATTVAFHIIGVVLWIGGLIGIASFLKRYIPQKDDQWFHRALKAALYGYCLPGLALTLFSGVYQLTLKGTSYYFKQGWFHMKLTLVLFLFVLTAITALNIVKLTKGDAVNSRTMQFVQLAASLSLVLIVFGTFHGIR